MKKEPLFSVGQVIRVARPEDFLTAFGQRIRDRDAVVVENLYEVGVPDRRFTGRVIVEFQKRNGRGQVFKEVMREYDFIVRVARC